MRKIILICGILWICAGLLYLSVNVSIRSSSEFVTALQEKVNMYLIVYFIVGAVFIYISMVEGKRKKFKIIRSYINKLIPQNKFSISHLEYSMNCGQNPLLVQKYFMRHMMSAKGGLTINSKGLISFDYKNISGKGNRKK